MAELIYSSVLPAATALSMRALEMASFEPSCMSSGVTGIPSLEAISFTLSCETCTVWAAGGDAGVAAAGVAAGAGVDT